MASRVRFLMRRIGRCLPTLLTLSACGAAPDNSDVDDLDRTHADSAQLTTPCSYNAVKKIMDVVVEAGETAVLATRALDNALLVNGGRCGVATTANTTRISVTENAGSPGDESVVVDLSAGAFGIGRGGAPGITIAFGAGNDAFSIRGGAGPDFIAIAADGIALNNDPNKDVLVTSSGAVSYAVALGAGADIFTGQGWGSGLGIPSVIGLTVDGGDGNDKLTGGSGADSLSGGDGDDTIIGANGDDTCAGDLGNDYFDESRLLTGSNGNDVYKDSGGGADTVDYGKRTSALRIDIEASAGGSNDDGEIALGESDQIDTGIDVIKGGSADDDIGGDGQSNILYGNDGADTLRGAGGDDSLYGGNDADQLIGGAGNDVLSGQAGDDVFDEAAAASGADTILGGAGIDTVDYSARSGALLITMNGQGADDGERSPSEGDNVGADVERCYAGSGADDITANAADNVLRGGNGADTLRGDDGSDTFDEVGAANGADVFIGGNGFDLVDYSTRTTALTVTMGGGAANDGASGENDNIGSDVESCLGGIGNDSFLGTAGDDYLDGGPGNDTIDGAAGNDVLSGGSGDDSLIGGTGEDLIDGETNAAGDVIDCGPGDSDIGLHGETTLNCEL